jgi:hypothetical protein
MGEMWTAREKRVSGLTYVEEGEPCSENRDPVMNSTRSRQGPVLKNNDICCSMNKNVSKRRTALVALSPHLQVTDSPVAQDHAPPAVCGDPSNGHEMATSSKNPRFSQGSCHRCVEMSTPRHSDAVSENQNMNSTQSRRAPGAHGATPCSSNGLLTCCHKAYALTNAYQPLQRPPNGRLFDPSASLRGIAFSPSC